ATAGSAVRVWPRSACSCCSSMRYICPPDRAVTRREYWWRGATPPWGKRVLVAVRLGQRESHEDWLDLGRDLARRGLRSPWLVVSDGAPGLIKAIEELWPEAGRGRCAVHKLRNSVARSVPG